MTIQSTKSHTDYLSLGFSIIAIFIVILSLFGIKEIWQLNNLRKEISSTNENIKKEMYATMHMTRALHRLCHSDIATDPLVKRNSAEDALKYLERIEKTAYLHSAILNWRAYALKRIGKIEEALKISEEAYVISKTDTYPFEKYRALYNSACYLSILGRKLESLPKLKETIKGDPSFKVIAKNDPDFASISDSDEFKEIVA